VTDIASVHASMAAVQRFSGHADSMDLAGAVVHGAAAGLFFAQALAWERAMNALVARALGAPPESVEALLVHAIATSGFGLVAILLITRIRQCCRFPVVLVTT
jgi:hypothetical protein